MSEFVIERLNTFHRYKSVRVNYIRCDTSQGRLESIKEYIFYTLCDEATVETMNLNTIFPVGLSPLVFDVLVPELRGYALAGHKVDLMAEIRLIEREIILLIPEARKIRMLNMCDLHCSCVVDVFCSALFNKLTLFEKGTVD